MGAIEAGELRYYDDDEQLRREEPTNEIGTISGRVSASLTRIARLGGDWCFVGDTKVDVFGHLCRLPDRELAWWRMEIRALRDTKNPLAVRAGDQVTVTEYPWSSGWVFSAAFKNARESARAELGTDWPETDPIALVRRVESLDFEPFETNKKYLTAGISEPHFSFETESCREQRQLLQYALGVCGDHEQALSDLQQDADLRRLQDLAERGKLIDPKSKANLVPEEMRDGAVLANVMTLAVQQAMAGPVHARDVRALDKKPVRWLVRQIFHDHLSRLRKLKLRLRPHVARARGEQIEGARAKSEVEPVAGDELLELIVHKLVSDLRYRAQCAALLDG